MHKNKKAKYFLRVFSVNTNEKKKKNYRGPRDLVIAETKYGCVIPVNSAFDDDSITKFSFYGDGDAFAYATDRFDSDKSFSRMCRGCGGMILMSVDSRFGIAGSVLRKGDEFDDNFSLVITVMVINILLTLLGSFEGVAVDVIAFIVIAVGFARCGC